MQSTTSIAVAWLRQGDRVLMGKRAGTLRLYPGMWDALGGHVEPGESPEAAVRRELEEEIGVIPDATVLIGTFCKPHPQGSGELSFHVFVVSGWSGTPCLANDEHSELRWFAVADAARLDLPHAAYRPMLAALAAPCR